MFHFSCCSYHFDAENLNIFAAHAHVQRTKTSTQVVNVRGNSESSYHLGQGNEVKSFIFSFGIPLHHEPVHTQPQLPTRSVAVIDSR